MGCPDLKQFDMSALSLDRSVTPNVVLLGRRGAGKTTAIQQTLHMNRDFVSDTIVMSPKEELDLSYTRSLAAISTDKQQPYGVVGIYKGLDDNVLTNVANRTKAPDHTRSCLVVDDCVYHQNAWRSSPLKNLWFNGRNMHVMMMIAMQYPIGMCPVMRVNIDYVFLFRDNNVRVRKIAYENYGGMFPTFESFCEALDKYANNPGEALVLHVHSRSDKIPDFAFWYRAGEAFTSAAGAGADIHTHTDDQGATQGNKRARTE